ncbi:hypothetical protein AWB81_01427 [Caballeronia arationis]|jgi:hypothetical protein|uniref:Uncharacterized protein n=1 Tax=Caballeronia arationis TaxID=1777142 RepID=A0A7Z7N3N2_9BURK|nr:hypothetical protein AWB81_01427 [Caballeronia arationis]SOE81056.1 hypothetical protein SAMN05446927_4312 [Caballeronia arationis]
MPSLVWRIRAVVRRAKRRGRACRASLCVVTKHAGAGNLAGRIAWEETSAVFATKRRTASRRPSPGAHAKNGFDTPCIRRGSRPGRHAIPGSSGFTSVATRRAPRCAESRARKCRVPPDAASAKAARAYRARMTDDRRRRSCGQAAAADRGCRKLPATCLWVSRLMCDVRHASQISAQQRFTSTLFAIGELRFSVPLDTLDTRAGRGGLR